MDSIGSAIRPQFAPTCQKAAKRGWKRKTAERPEGCSCKPNQVCRPCIMRDRFENGRDIFSGESLEGMDAHQWLELQDGKRETETPLIEEDDLEEAFS